MEAHAALSQVPLLAHLPEDRRREVIAVGHERRLERGEFLFHEGERTEAFFAVLEGQLKLVRTSPRGKELLLHLVHPGQSFAEAALFGEGTYPASAVAIEPSRVWCWPRRRFEDLLRHSPDLALALLGSVALWTRRLAAKLELLTQRRVEERVAVYVLSRAGERTLTAGDAVDLPEARNLIAAQCGTAPEVLSRTFRRLEDDGILHAEPDRVVIRDPERLHQLAEWIGD
jgi:CRP/FNR family transcriptional regulator